MRVKSVCALTVLFLALNAHPAAAQTPNADGGPADAGLDGGEISPPLGTPTTPPPELPPATALTDAGGPVPEDERDEGCRCVTARAPPSVLVALLVLLPLFTRSRRRATHQSSMHKSG